MLLYALRSKVLPRKAYPMFEPRKIESKPDWLDSDGIKIYTVSADGSEVDRQPFLQRMAEVKESRDLAWASLPAFAIFHKGTSYLYLVLAWWGNDNELFNSVSVLCEDHWVEDANRFSFCLYDLEVFWAERNIYVDTIYTSQGDLSDYRQRRLTVIKP